MSSTASLASRMARAASARRSAAYFARFALRVATLTANCRNLKSRNPNPKLSQELRQSRSRSADCRSLSARATLSGSGTTASNGRGESRRPNGTAPGCAIRSLFVSTHKGLPSAGKYTKISESFFRVGPLATPANHVPSESRHSTWSCRLKSKRRTGSDD